MRTRSIALAVVAAFMLGGVGVAVGASNEPRLPELKMTKPGAPGGGTFAPGATPAPGVVVPMGPGPAVQTHADVVIYRNGNYDTVRVPVRQVTVPQVITMPDGRKQTAQVTRTEDAADPWTLPAIRSDKPLPNGGPPPGV